MRGATHARPARPAGKQRPASAGKYGGTCMLESGGMKWTEREKLAALMAFHLLWGLVLWFSISKYGLGISTDSVGLLFGGLNLSQGRGLIDNEGGFLGFWPPLYPALLALLHIMSGLSTFAAANVLQALAFVGVSICLSVLFLRIFPGNFLLALAANVLSDVGAVVLVGFDVVGSDYIHLFLVIFFVLLTGFYIGYRSARTFLALCVVGMLAALQRYLGVAALATGVAAILFLAGGTLQERLRRSILLSLCALPTALWLVVTSPLYVTRSPVTFTENFTGFSRSILGWFFPVRDLKSHLDLYIMLLWIVVAGLIIAVFAFSHRYRVNGGPPSATTAAARPAPASFSLPVLIYGLCYVLALFGAAALAYYNKLDGRFLLPIYIPFVTLLVLAIEIPVSRAKQAPGAEVRLIAWAASCAALLSIAVLLLHITLPLVAQSHARGAAGGENEYNTESWHENRAVKYWQSHPPQGQYLLFSNQTDGVAFITGHPVTSSPRRTSGPYGTEQFAVSQYRSELFSSRLDVYILWIEPNPHSYMYNVDELAPIAQIEVLFRDADGAVYRLRPKPGT